MNPSIIKLKVAARQKLTALLLVLTASATSEQTMVAPETQYKKLGVVCSNIQFGDKEKREIKTSS